MPFEVSSPAVVAEIENVAVKHGATLRQGVNGAAAGEPRALVGDDCAAVMREEIKPMEWTIDGLLPKGLYLLCDREKGGKSYLAIQMGLAVACGRGVFRNSDKFTPAKGGRVHYFDLEMDKATFQERLHFLDAKALLPGRMQRFSELGRLTETGMPELASLLDRDAADFIIIDTLAAATRSSGARTQDVFKSEYEELARVRDLAHARNITVLILHHTNKAITENAFDAISGTRARGAATDGNLVISRKRGIVTLHGVGRRLGELEIAIKLWRNGVPGWSLLGDAADVRRSAERDAVLNVLSSGEPMTSSGTAKALSKNRNTVRWLLCEMAKDGEIERDGEGRYKAVLTPRTAGSSAL
ncbi:MAG: AAA family ATPase [Acidobacteria bacterium]|nr:AAA family ATPase [Acidobacteriota bacterium]